MPCLALTLMLGPLGLAVYLALRALRQDRVTGLLTQWVSDELGPEYVNQPAFDMEGCYQESSAATPMAAGRAGASGPA